MNPACAVCTIAIGASIGIARRIGVDDTVIGVFFGALMTVCGFWLIKYFEKKNWNFSFRNSILMLLSLSSVIPMYFGILEYKKDENFYLDIFLFAYLLGGLIYITTSRLYQVIKLKRGHAHFPFEKVVLPVSSLFITSLIFNFDFSFKVYILCALLFGSLISLFLCNNILEENYK